MSAVNRLPAPGPHALEARRICQELDRAVATIARRGISDYAAVDAAGAEFLLSIVRWEIAHDVRLWPWVLSAYQDVLNAVREAATDYAREDAGEGWKLG